MMMMKMDPNPTRNPRRRAVRSPAYCRVRLKKSAVSGGGGGGKSRSGGTATPLLKWKFEEEEDSSGGSSAPESDKRSRDRSSNVVSARRLAAGIWMLTEGVEGGCFQPNFSDLHSSRLHANIKNDRDTPTLVNKPKNGMLHKLEASAALPNPSMERATKWDSGFYSHLKLIEDQQFANVSVVSSLRSDLEQARSRITELETERRVAKKKLEQFLKKLSEDKETWRRREHEKVRAIIDSMKDDLIRERKNRQRMEIVNSKLVNELAEAKLSAKRFLHDYEKERKARELMEEVCDELAKEIGEDKAEVEALKVESMRIREEVEEERKMLQMAEVWREERVQMKLVDAKLTLEDKYSELSKLQSEIEAFLRARSNSHPDVEEKREAELLREAAESVKLQEIKEFSYQPPSASEDIFSAFEELQPREETIDREIEPCYGYTNGMINGCYDKSTKGFTNGAMNTNGDTEGDSGWETVSHGEEQGSSNSLEGSEPSVTGICEESNASISGTDWDENRDIGNLNSEISEVCSTTKKGSRKMGSSISRLWRSSCPNNGEIYKKNTFEVTNGRFSNARISNATSNGRMSNATSNGRMSNATLSHVTLSPDRKSGEVDLSSPSVGNWSSPDSVNPHITRGNKGCIEWPRGMQKHSLKAKLLEARMESQKIQLRQALKQKI